MAATSPEKVASRVRSPPLEHFPAERKVHSSAEEGAPCPPLGEARPFSFCPLLLPLIWPMVAETLEAHLQGIWLSIKLPEGL